MNASANRIKTFKSEKLAFYNWILKWASNNNFTAEEVPVDTPQIAAVLQALGFKLETVDQPSNSEQLRNDTFGMIIEVKCSKSGIRAVLSKSLETCICPSSETASQSHFWAVSGKGPSTSQENLNRVDETHSSVLPALSKDKTMLIRDILTKLFAIISETDENQNEQLVQNVKDSWRIRSLSDLTRPPLIRQNTWEVDPKTSPPISTSSPLPEFSKSSSHNQPSLNTDKEQLLAEILQTVKDNLEKALIMLPHKNNTFTKSNVKRVSNIKISPTVVTPTRSTTGKSTPDLPTRKTPKKKLQNENTPKSSSRERRQLVVASKIGSFRNKTDLLPPSSFKNKLAKTDPSSALERKPIASLSPAISVQKRTIGSISKNSSLRISNTNLSANSPGLKSSKPKSGIPSFGFQSAASKIGGINPLKKSK